MQTQAVAYIHAHLHGHAVDHLSLRLHVSLAGRCFHIGPDTGAQVVALQGFHYLRRRYAVLLVVFHLFLPPSEGLVDGQLHRCRHRVGIHYNLSVDVACRSAGCLCQTAV